MADGVRLMRDQLARHGSTVRGHRGHEPQQLEGDARRALRRHLLPPLADRTRQLRGGGHGISRHVAES